MEHEQAPTRAVILAAGDGGRLDGLIGGLPKPLIPLDGRPIVEYTFDAVAAAGIEEVLVVTGYREHEVRRALRVLDRPFQLSFVSNPQYTRGASFSLRAARVFAHASPTFLLMADHLLGPDLLRTLKEDYAGQDRDSLASLVAADSSPREAVYTAEASKLVLADGPSPRLVRAIGKALPQWDALDAGAFVLAPSAWDLVDAAPFDCELFEVFAGLARAGALRASDISGMRWYDIDTPADLSAAGPWLAAHRDGRRAGIAE